MGNVKQRENKSLKCYLARFNVELAHVAYTLDKGVLMHVTSGVLPESKLWEELLEQECRMLIDFYRKVGKYLRIESSKEALHKSKEPKSG